MEFKISSTLMVILLFGINKFSCFSQANYHGLSISTYEDNQLEYLQGQMPSYCYLINNESYSKQIENHPHRRINYLVYIPTGDTLKYKGGNLFRNTVKNNYPYGYPSQANYEKSMPSIPLKKGESQARYLTLFLEDFGQNSMEIKNTGRYMVTPLFLNPGKYELAFEEHLVPSRDMISLKYEFSVVEPQKNDKAYFDQYKELLQEIFSQTDTNKLYNNVNTFLNDLNNPYIESFNGILSMEIIYPNTHYPNLAYLRKNPNLIFNIFEILPRLKTLKNLGFLNSFYTNFSHFAPEFEKKGWIKDWKTYKTEYFLMFKNRTKILEQEIITGLKEWDYYINKITNK